jgi:DNA-directed RNA polymerase subunit RPC12/RpoP
MRDKRRETPEEYKARKNYPFGRKSKPQTTSGKRCPECGYTKLK